MESWGTIPMQNFTENPNFSSKMDKSRPVISAIYCFSGYVGNGRELSILDEIFGFSVKFCIGIVLQDSIRRHLVPKLLPFACDLERFYIVLTKNYTHGAPSESPTTTMKSRIHLIFFIIILKTPALAYERGCSILGALQHIEQASNRFLGEKSVVSS